MQVSDILAARPGDSNRLAERFLRRCIGSHEPWPLPPHARIGQGKASWPRRH